MASLSLSQERIAERLKRRRKHLRTAFFGLVAMAVLSTLIPSSPTPAVRDKVMVQGAMAVTRLPGDGTLGTLADEVAFEYGSAENPRVIAAVHMPRYGWDRREFDCLNKLWMRESGWKATARNASSGAYGIPQSLPATKMSSAGTAWRTDPDVQIRWGLSYIKARYGTPCRAWAHSRRTGWY